MRYFGQRYFKANYFAAKFFHGVSAVVEAVSGGGFDLGRKRPWHPWLDFPRLAVVVEEDEELADAVIEAVAQSSNLPAVQVAQAEQMLKARLAARQQVWKQMYLELIQLEYERREQEFEDFQIAMLLFDM